MGEFMKNDNASTAIVAIVVFDINTSSSSYIQVCYYNYSSFLGRIEDCCRVYALR